MSPILFGDSVSSESAESYSLRPSGVSDTCHSNEQRQTENLTTSEGWPFCPREFVPLTSIRFVEGRELTRAEESPKIRSALAPAP